MTTLSVSGRIAVQPRKPLCVDCWTMIGKWQFRVLGDQRACNVCDNKMVVTSSDDVGPQDYRGTFSETGASRTEKEKGDWAIQTLALSQAKFGYADEADKWVDGKKLVSKRRETKSHWLYAQTPADWFQGGFLKVVRIENGVLALIGLRKAEFAGKTPTTEEVDLSKSMDMSGSDLMTEKVFVPFAAKPAVPAKVSTGEEVIPMPAEGECPASHPVASGGKCMTRAAAEKSNVSAEELAKVFPPPAAAAPAVPAPAAPAPAAPAAAPVPPAPPMAEAETVAVTWLEMLTAKIKSGEIRGDKVAATLQEIMTKLAGRVAPVPGAPAAPPAAPPAALPAAPPSPMAKTDERRKGFHARLQEVLSAK